MRTLVFCTTFWDDKPELAEAKKPELLDWLLRVDKRFNSPSVFLATGCQDKPELNPLRSWGGKLWDRRNDIPVISSGEPKTKPYDIFHWSYFLCAFEAALWHAKSQSFDLLVELESNCWINPSLNLPKLFGEFLARPELILSPAWCDQPDFHFLVMKPAAVPAFLHHRLRGNLVNYDQPKPMLAEIEIGRIFKDRWWKPWAEPYSIRQGYNVSGWTMVPDEEAKHWPVVGMPSPGIQKLFV